MRDNYRTRQQRRDAQDPRIMRLYSAYRPEHRRKYAPSEIATVIILATLILYACYVLHQAR